MTIPLEGRLIRYWRTARGISLTELARRIDPPVTHSAVWQWEKGVTRPANVPAIAVALGLTMVEFYAAEPHAPAAAHEQAMVAGGSEPALVREAVTAVGEARVGFDADPCSSAATLSALTPPSARRHARLGTLLAGAGVGVFAPGGSL